MQNVPIVPVIRSNVIGRWGDHHHDVDRLWSLVADPNGEGFRSFALELPIPSLSGGLVVCHHDAVEETGVIVATGVLGAKPRRRCLGGEAQAIIPHQLDRHKPSGLDIPHGEAVPSHWTGFQVARASCKETGRSDVGINLDLGLAPFQCGAPWNGRLHIRIVQEGGKVLQFGLFVVFAKSRKVPRANMSRKARPDIAKVQTGALHQNPNEQKLAVAVSPVLGPQRVHFSNDTGQSSVFCQEPPQHPTAVQVTSSNSIVQTHGFGEEMRRSIGVPHLVQSQGISW